MLLYTGSLQRPKGSGMYLNTKAKRRTDQQRRIRAAIAAGETKVDGMPLKRYSPLVGTSQAADLRCRAAKKSNRRRVSMALRQATYDPNLDIPGNPNVESGRLVTAAIYHFI